MPLNYHTFEENAHSLKTKIATVCAACGRDPSGVQVVAVTKAHPVEAIDFATRYGLKMIGENRIQEALIKKPQTKAAIRWELIGHLQSNKAKLAVSIFDRIQTVDRIRLLRALERYSGEQSKTLPVLLQVNAGDDPKKFGVTCEDAPALLEAVLDSKHLKVEGLMTIAPHNTAVATATFERLRMLRERLSEKFGIPLPELSMGMTGDMVEAIRAGSTCVRIGTALFGEREYES